jgi:hypothetical protein
MQIGGGTKWNGHGWQAYGRDQYSKHEAYVLTSLDVKVGVDVLTNHISAEWWSSTKGYCFYSSLKKMIKMILSINKTDPSYLLINETDPSYQNAKKFIDLIQSQLETIINLRNKKNIEEFERRKPHPPIEDVITNEDKHRTYIQFIKSYGGHIHYLKHITIAYYLLHLMPEPKVESILYQTHSDIANRVFTSIVNLANEYANFKCDQNYTKIPSLDKWRNNYNEIKLELTQEEQNNKEFWKRRPLLCNQKKSSKAYGIKQSVRRKQRKKSTRHRRRQQKKSTRHRRRQQKKHH